MPRSLSLSLSSNSKSTLRSGVVAYVRENQKNICIPSTQICSWIDSFFEFSPLVKSTLWHRSLWDTFEYPAEILLDIELFLSKVSEGIPPQYIITRAAFWGREFFCDPRVLIPRPETEGLVERGLELIRNIKGHIRVADIGTGSGCIITTLALEGPEGEYIGTDLSPTALEVAEINRQEFQKELTAKSSIELLQSDRLSELEGTFDLIISNPPYIHKDLERPLVQDSVDAHEPQMALYLEDNLYQKWFTDFFSQALEKLKPGGFFLMEGHEHHLDSQRLQLEALGGENCIVYPDLCQRPRYLQGQHHEQTSHPRATGHPRRS